VLKPVSRSLSLLAAFFRLMHVAIYGVDALNHFAPLSFLQGSDYLTAFKPDQLQALALAFITLHDMGYSIALVFFGFHCLLIGYLLFGSAFLPRVLGVLMAIAGVCYLINSFANFLSPAFAGHLFPYILLPCLVAEGSLMLWLLVTGVNVQRWRQQASTSVE
jgi:hypothetical protein